MRKIMAAAIMVAAGASAAGCGGSIMHVSASDPVWGICSSATVVNLDQLDGTIDMANADPEGGWSTAGVPWLTAANRRQLSSSARALQADIPVLRSWGHDQLAIAFSDEAELLTNAAQSPTGYTNNNTATSTDTQTSIIDGDCGSLQLVTAHTAAHHARPGPGAWSWVLFWLSAGGYLLMIILVSVIVSLAERQKQRESRLSPGKIISLSLAWPVILLLMAAGAWKSGIARLRLTPGERSEDRRRELQASISRLESEVEKK